MKTTNACREAVGVANLRSVPISPNVLDIPRCTLRRPVSMAAYARALLVVVCLVRVSIDGGWLYGQETSRSSEPNPATDATVPLAEPLTPPAAPLPLHARIDAALPIEMELLAAPPAEDGLLLRRLSLDLRGVVPSREELETFEADVSTTRWATWVAKFLADPLCDEHLVAFLDRTIMLRRSHTHVDRSAWLNFLREQVASNTSIDGLSKTLLFSPWWNQDHRATQRFYLDRGGDPNLIARDLGRVFLGRDMQCAQCHDHPLVADYKQIDYHGLLAYVATSSLAEATYKDAEGKDQKIQLYIERAAGDAPFESVFDKGIPFRSGPRMPVQTEQIEEYAMPDARYATESLAGSLPGVAMPPKNSRRQMLADQLTSRSNRAFVVNWANRWWALAFGIGLVQPLDMHHPDNPPSHPELLELIADGFLEMDMQPRRFLEQLVLTNVYRRGGVTRLQKDSPTFAASSIDQSAKSSLREFATAKLAERNESRAALLEVESKASVEYEAMLAEWRKAQGERASMRAALDAAEAAMLDAKKKATESAAAAAAAQQRQSSTTARIALLDESAAKLQQAADLAGSDDPELKQAIAVAKQRAESARAQIAEIDKAVIDTRAAADTAAPVLLQSTAAVQDIVTKLQPVHQRLVASDAMMIASRNRWSAANSQRSAVDREIVRQRNILAWLESIDTVDRIAGQVSSGLQHSIAIEAELPAVDEGVASVQNQSMAAQQSQQAAAAQLAAAKGAMEKHAAEIEQLQRSLDALAASTNLISLNEPLVIAQQAIQLELDKRRMQAGQLQSSIDTAQQALVASESSLAMLAQELGVRQTAQRQVQERLAAARTDIQQKKIELISSKGTCLERWEAIRIDGEQRLATTGLRPLTPEQLCWSTLRATGQLDAHIQIELAELEKQSPLAADADENAVKQRRRQAVRGAYDKLRAHTDVFASLYASGPDKTEDDFLASADQALYTSNAGSVFAWAGPGHNNVTQQSIDLTDGDQIARLLYSTLLCRQPTADELKLVGEQIAASGDQRHTVIQEMVWGLLASAEFRFVR